MLKLGVWNFRASIKTIVFVKWQENEIGPSHCCCRADIFVHVVEGTYGYGGIHLDFTQLPICLKCHLYWIQLWFSLNNKAINLVLDQKWSTVSLSDVCKSLSSSLVNQTSNQIQRIQLLNKYYSIKCIGVTSRQWGLPSFLAMDAMRIADDRSENSIKWSTKTRNDLRNRPLSISVRCIRAGRFRGPCAHISIRSSSDSLPTSNFRLLYGGSSRAGLWSHITNGVVMKVVTKAITTMMAKISSFITYKTHPKNNQEERKGLKELHFNYFFY